MTRINRRQFAGLGLSLAASTAAEAAQSAQALTIPDDGWQLWLDRAAVWQDDTIYLPDDVRLKTLPVNPPSGGWDALAREGAITVTLPATVEQQFWGANGSRPYTMDEFTYADSDSEARNGAYTGVSWWWREIAIPVSAKGRRLILNIRGARLRVEVYLNRKLVGYSILEQLPFECDLTAAAVPGGKNVLAIRITNPGGRYDWVDGDTLSWGKVKIQRSHGFGGLDRGMRLSTHPMGARISDLWVLNTPKPGVVNVFVSAKVSGKPPRAPLLSIVDDKSNQRLMAQFRALGHSVAGKTVTWRFEASAKDAALWDLETPHLYRLIAMLSEDRREQRFGFRWFTVEGLGDDARFSLNGRHIKLYSAISWGYWGGNGMWPTPDLAEKEVTQAKALGLNCLAFHRNPGKHDVLEAQDRLGLLRAMEPGGGKFAFGRLPDGAAVDQHSLLMQPPVSEADKFCQRYVMAKICLMMRTFRSHPSLIHWTLQNENNADFADPTVTAVLEAMRAEDESRIILMNDGMSSPEIHAAQAFYAPYDAKLHRSDREAWGGWWDDHQGAGDQWYDSFYQDPQHFTYRNSTREQIVEYGEMEGCAVPDNHTMMVAEILSRGGKAYDLKDHQEILAAYQGFLDRWGFRGAFPNAETLFKSIGHKAYASWQNYMENIRIADAVDYAAISGWETTAIDNHSGIVDNFRNFKSDPALIAGSLLSVRPVAKQRRLTVPRGEAALFDFYLLNDSGRAIEGTLRFSMTDPKARRTVLISLPAPSFQPTQMSALVQEGFATPPLEQEGRYRFEFAFTGALNATHVRDIWVVEAKRAPASGKTLKVGVTGVWPSLRAQLAKLPGVTVEEFVDGKHYDVVISSGLTENATAGQKLGGDAGMTLDKNAKTKTVAGALPEALLDAVKNGLPLLVLAQEDGLADGVARQLAEAGAFTYHGQVGRYRAPWMGNWYFLADHPLYSGMPANQAMDGFFQARGRLANGLMVEGPGVTVVAGYSRDHDRRIGAGSFTTKLGEGKIVFQRVPDMAAPMQLRFLSNALSWLAA
ncbi:MAG: glycoside hydrolase family 2 TIM barrel-domain containing protein [Rhizomicrobium sp.]|nr:glycoside hydrolase family 2 TIM barrel-domain containing protein [Rhizomicrobium sp.]